MDIVIPKKNDTNSERFRKTWIECLRTAKPYTRKEDDAIPYDAPFDIRRSSALYAYTRIFDEDYTGTPEQDEKIRKLLEENE